MNAPNTAGAPYDDCVNVTPDLAAKWLEGNVLNRPLKQAHVDRLAREMKAGRWLLTHQGIAFDVSGCLIDGQHRLWAVVESGVTVPLRVFRNQPAGNLYAVDNGERRTNLDILNLTGAVGDVTAKDLATLRAMLGGISARGNATSACEEGEQYRRHQHAVGFAVKHLGVSGRKGLATAQIRAVIARATYTADEQRLIHFCDVLRSGVPADEHDHVILALRDFLARNQSAGNGESVQRVRYAKTEWALDAYLNGRTSKRLCGSDVELFLLPEEARSTNAKLPRVA